MTQKKPHLCGFRGFYIDDNCRKPDLENSVEGILGAIVEVSTASNEGAAGTTNIAGKAVSLTNMSEDILNNASGANDVALQLKENIAKFVV